MRHLYKPSTNTCYCCLLRWPWRSRQARIMKSMHVTISNVHVLAYATMYTIYRYFGRYQTLIPHKSNLIDTCVRLVSVNAKDLLVRFTEQTLALIAKVCIIIILKVNTRCKSRVLSSCILAPRWVAAVFNGSWTRPAKFTHYSPERTGQSLMLFR